MARSRWQTFEEWKGYGMEKGYDKRSPTSLESNNDKNERSWYYRGRTKKWMKDFKFSFIVPFRSEYQNFEEWKDYGIGKSYDKINPTRLARSEDPKERAWYKRGINLKWIKDFDFQRINHWQAFEEWENYGIKNKFHQRSPKSLKSSEDSKERNWYNRGTTKRWIKNFQFTYLVPRSVVPPRTEWPSFDEWKNYGMEKGYDKRSSSGLSESQDLKERSWYIKGSRQKWRKLFPFQRMWVPNYSLDDLIQETPESIEIIKLGTYSTNVSSIAEILVSLYPDKFKSMAEVARALPRSVGSISHALRPFTLEDAKNFIDAVEPIPTKIRYNLDELLYSILIDQYQISFNQNPKRTINEITQFNSKYRNNDIGTLAQRVLEFYESVYSFSIPGHGTIKDYIK